MAIEKKDESRVGSSRSDRLAAIEAVTGNIEKQFGKGAIMRLGEGTALPEVLVMSTGSLALDVALVARLNNASLAAPVVTAPNPGLERVSDVPIYSTDAVVRRAASLQRTADARPPVVGVPSALWQQLRLQAGDKVCVMQGTATVVLPAREDAALANGCVRVPAGHPDTAGLGAMFGPISVEKLVRP